MILSVKHAIFEVERTFKDKPIHTDPINPSYRVQMNLHLASQTLAYGMTDLEALDRLDRELIALGPFDPYESEAGKDRREETRDRIAEHLTQYITKTRPDLAKIDHQRRGMA